MKKIIENLVVLFVWLFAALSIMGQLLCDKEIFLASLVFLFPPLIYSCIKFFTMKPNKENENKN